jgi:hypothetical protein
MKRKQCFLRLNLFQKYESPNLKNLPVRTIVPKNFLLQAILCFRHFRIKNETFPAGWQKPLKYGI